MSKGSAKRRLGSEIVVIGVDMAKESFVAVAEFDDGAVSKPKKFTVGREGFEAFLAFAGQEVGRRGRSRFVVALEPTGPYAEPLVAWLVTRDVVVYNVPPLLTRRMKEIEDGTTRKTDPKDARVIADLCRSGRGRPWRLVTGPFAELKALSRRRWQIVRRRTAVLNRLHAYLDVVFPEFPTLFGDVACPTARWVLGVAPTPDALLAVPEEVLVAGLLTASRRQLGAERAAALRAAAATTVGCRKGVVAQELVLAQYLADLEQVETHLAAVEAQMGQALGAVPYAERLLAISDLGRVTLATLLGEVGDLAAFAVPAQLIKHVGLDLIEASSGKKNPQRVVQKVSKRGSAQARRMLYLAGVRLGQGALAGPRYRLVEEGQEPGSKAAIANARRLLRILHAMVKTGSTFDPSRHVPPPPAPQQP